MSKSLIHQTESGVKLYVNLDTPAPQRRFSLVMSFPEKNHFPTHEDFDLFSEWSAKLNDPSVVLKSLPEPPE